jgi:hypothetical protein
MIGGLDSSFDRYQPVVEEEKSCHEVSKTRRKMRLSDNFLVHLRAFVTLWQEKAEYFITVLIRNICQKTERTNLSE